MRASAVNGVASDGSTEVGAGLSGCEVVRWLRSRNPPRAAGPHSGGRNRTLRGDCGPHTVVLPMIWVVLGAVCLAASTSSDPRISLLGDVCSSAIPGGALRARTARVVLKKTGSSQVALTQRISGKRLAKPRRPPARVSDFLEILEQLPVPPPTTRARKSSTEEAPPSVDKDQSHHDWTSSPRAARFPRSVNIEDLELTLRPAGHFIVGRNIDFEVAGLRGKCDLVARTPQGAYACVIRRAKNLSSDFLSLNDQIVQLMFLGAPAKSVGLPTDQRLQVRMIVRERTR